eukprot:m51a1_g2883 hypothetical protein (507) ;mRNA; f:405512-410032
MPTTRMEPCPACRAITVSSVGDINADGITDIVVTNGVSTMYSWGAGMIYLVFGRHSWADSTQVNLTLLGTPAGAGTGVAILGEENDNLFGCARNMVDHADLNGDGIEDIVLSNLGKKNIRLGNGAVYVIFGRRTWPASLKVSVLHLTQAGMGFALNGWGGIGASFGLDISAAGDLNGDGIADLLIGFYGNPNRYDSTPLMMLLWGRHNWTAVSPNDVNGDSAIANNGGVWCRAPILSKGISDFNGDGIDDYAATESAAARALEPAVKTALKATTSAGRGAVSSLVRDAGATPQAVHAVKQSLFQTKEAIRALTEVAARKAAQEAAAAGMTAEAAAAAGAQAAATATGQITRQVAVAAAAKGARSCTAFSGAYVAVAGAWELVQYRRGLRTRREVAVNLAGTGAGAVASIGGYALGAALGTMMLPGVGTFVGGLVGSLAAGWGAEIGTRSALGAQGSAKEPVEGTHEVENGAKGAELLEWSVQAVEGSESEDTADGVQALDSVGKDC